jgi:hypothetical protein
MVVAAAGAAGCAEMLIEEQAPVHLPSFSLFNNRY